MNINDRPDVSAEKLQGTVENALNGLKIFNLLKTSIELGIFDFLNEPMSCEQVSNKLGVEPILTYYLLEILAKLGLMDKTGEFYKNSRTAKVFLNSESDYNRNKCILSLEGNVDLWNNLNNTLHGKISREDESFFPEIIQVMAEDCLSGELHDTVDLVADCDEFKSSKTLLDVGGGHGLYSIAFSQMNPDLQCYVFDFPEVLKETQKFIERYSSSVLTIPGNFYRDDFGGSYDMIFSSYNPGGKNPKIAEKIYNSLNLDGLFVNKQYFPEESKNSLGDLLDNMEWNFTNFEKSNKAERRFSFKGDLGFEEYSEFLEGLGFSIIGTHDISHLNTSFGTRSEDKVIIAKKVR